MKVIVIGAGLLGATTAYFLGKRGHEVTVIDRQAGAGRATSFAKGALLTPGMRDSFGDIEVIQTWRADESRAAMDGVAHEFLPGHKIRLTITPSLYPLYARN